MENETAKTHHLIMNILAVLGSLYPMRLAFTQTMQTLKIALDQVLLHLVPHNADFEPAVPILSAAFSAAYCSRPPPSS